MFADKRIAVIMPAYNAARTLRRTYDEVMAQKIVDLIIIVDDASTDETAAIAAQLPCVIFHRHPRNKGYGANQKTCYRLALQARADIVIMVHPDYQYTPALIPAMASMVGNGLYHCVLASRILGGYALTGGMPRWKYLANRVLTLTENLLTGAKLSEYHSGYRAYSCELLKKVPFESNSDNFVFDNEILLQALWAGYRIAEITCPARYFPDMSSINFLRSVEYGIGCLLAALRYRWARMRLPGRTGGQWPHNSDKSRVEDRALAEFSALGPRAPDDGLPVADGALGSNPVSRINAGQPGGTVA
jgi:glycosyltransferase involved in cell wall biosynthesis